MSREEQQFSVNFSRFINENNVEKIIATFDDARTDIAWQRQRQDNQPRRSHKNHPAPQAMKSFLRRIANRYIANEADDIGRVCFVFPNKRSATFFREAVELESDGRIRNIRTKTINSFVAGFSRAREAGRLEALFVMFKEYRRILEEQTTSSADDALDFDRFAFWGDMLINDFNDVDRYLADPDKIFVNAKRFKEINSNYLTPEQVEAIKRYWGEDRSQMSVENFWTHVDSRGRSTVHTKFLRLWEVMALALSPLSRCTALPPTDYFGSYIQRGRRRHTQRRLTATDALQTLCVYRIQSAVDIRTHHFQSTPRQRHG